MFITLEGIEGAGKSTVMLALAEYIHACGEPTLVTREPGGSRMGRRLRSMLLDCRQEAPDYMAELFLFLADRAQHIAELIQPALDAGQNVLCDRYTDSTIAYQGYGRGMSLDTLKQINKLASKGVMPALTLLLDLPVQTGLSRAGARNQKEGTIISEGRFDSESVEFHEKVRNGYLQLAMEEPERITIIDATQPPDAVVSACIDAYEARKKQYA